MSVHYKFKSALSFDTITFDGLHISIRDLKKSILQQKQIGKASDFDLQITNAQSNEVYEDDNTLVPKNSSLIVVRIPLTSQQKKAWEKSDALPALGNKLGGDLQDPHANKLAKTVDLANVEASEADKIQAAITQSTLDYDPSNYLRIKGSNQVGEIPTNYRCFKCNQPGHWIKDCKLSTPQETNVDIKKSTGIPQSFMVPVEGPLVPGAMMTPTGHYAVPSIEHEARREPVRKAQEPIPVEKPVIPEDLICGVCKDLLADAVLIPCCGNSFCDECIRNVLLESEDHQCPDCKEKDVSPDTLIPNRFLRTSVNNFRNQTGYCRAAPSIAQNKIAAQPRDAPPHPVEAAPNTDNPPPSSATPLTQPPKDNGPPPRRERMSPDDVEIVDESAPVPGTIPAISSDDTVASPIDSISSIQPIHHIVTHSGPMDKSYKHYSHNDDYHKRGPPFKPHFRVHDRSDTPTVDETSSEPLLFPIESLAPPPPRMMMNQRPPPPHMFPTGNFVYRPNYPPPPRHDMAPFPPGVDHMPPRMPMNYRGNSYFIPRAPRPPYRPPHPSNGPHHAPNVGPVDDPLEVFNRMLKEKDLGRGRDRPRFRRRSRSFSRSYSRSPSPRVRSRPPRSRSRSSTRIRSRTRSPPPRSPRSPPPRSRSRSNIRRRSRSRSFSISSRSRSPPPRSPRSIRSYHSRSPSRDRGRHYSPLPPARKKIPPPHRLDSPPPRHHSPIRYYSRGYKDEYGPPPKGDRDRPIERLDRDRDRDVRPRSRERDRGDRGRRFKPSSVVQEYYSSNQDFNRHPNDRYDSKDGRYGDRPRDRDRDFDKDRDRDRERVVYKRDRIPGPLDETVPPPPHKYDNYEVRDRIRSDWEKTRDRELELQERERERQAAAGNSAPGSSDYYHGDKGGSGKKREPSRGRPVEPITGVPRGPLPPEHPDDRERELNYVPTAQDSPLTETQSTNTKSPKSPEKEKKSKEKKKKKSKDESEKKKKKKKVKEKSEKKESSEHGDVASTPGCNENDEESKPPPEQPPVREDPLYGDLVEKSEIVDIGVVETYTKAPEEVKDPPKDKDVVLAPVPELSKWEKEDEPLSQSEERIQENGSETKQVTSEVLKRAENAIFKKSINPIASEKKTERKVEGKKSSKERDKVEPAKEIAEKPKEEKVVAHEATDKPKEKEPSKPVVVVEREVSPKKVEKREDRREDRDRRERDERDRRERDERDRHREREKERDRERERERERREQEREREERYRLKMLEKEKERQLQISKEIADRERFAMSEKNRGSSERKIETIPLRISAKERLGAKVEDRVDVKKRLERREVKTEKPSKKPRRDSESNDLFEKKKEEDRIVTTTDDKKEVIVISQATAESQALQAKKRSVSLDTDRLVKKIKLAQDEGSTVDSGSSSDESVTVKKHKKKKKKKHRKKKKKRRHSSSDSDSSSSSSDSETEKKKKKKSKKSKKRKKSKK